MAIVGQGSKVFFADSSFSGDLMSINGWDVTRADIDTTTLATTGARTNTPSELYDPGTLDLTFEYDGDAPNISSTAETVSLYFGSTSSTAPNWVGTGYVVSMSPSVGDEERLTIDMSVRFSGVITFSTA